MEFREATFTKKTGLFVENDVVLKSYEREACLTLPNITVLKTRIEKFFEGGQTHQSLSYR